ncbi:hypothetical protein Kisp02_49670 [Kineosporia sp. NBRC 101731]|nr:hypothetical protein Kisp02_49670 [Kineosporia sp. NBRC 101731]
MVPTAANERGWDVMDELTYTNAGSYGYYPDLALPLGPQAAARDEFAGGRS